MKKLLVMLVLGILVVEAQAEPRHRSPRNSQLHPAPSAGLSGLGRADIAADHRSSRDRHLSQRHDVRARSRRPRERRQPMITLLATTTTTKPDAARAARMMRSTRKETRQ
jgi:hypothetical protein